MPDPITLLVAALAAAALLALLASRRAAGALRARLVEAEEAARGALSRAERAERDAEHRGERAAEAQRLHDALRDEFREAHQERARLGAREAELMQEVRGLRGLLETASDERATISGKLDGARDEIADLRAANEGLHAQLKAQREALEARAAELRALPEALGDRFRALAEETLRTQGETFGRVNRERVEALLRPMREQVEGFQGELRAAHANADTERKLLKQEIERLSRSSQAISAEATALARALRGDKQRQGAWGEMLLERILEESGLREGLHYERQASARDEAGRLLRPDIVVRLPGDRRLVIDSKVSLNAYADATAAETEEQAQRHLAAHVAAVRAHVEALSRKDYAAAVGGSVDYVMMFMPVESALGAAWRQGDDLAAHAIERRIAIVTPTTLLTVLRTVQHVWAVEARNANAERIAERAGHLYDKVKGFVDDMSAIGAALERAQASYDGAMGKLSTGRGNVLGQVEKLKRLGARTGKTIGVPFDGADDDEPPAIEAAE